MLDNKDIIDFTKIHDMLDFKMLNNGILQASDGKNGYYLIIGLDSGRFTASFDGVDLIRNTNIYQCLRSCNDHFQEAIHLSFFQNRANNFKKKANNGKP